MLYYVICYIVALYCCIVLYCLYCLYCFYCCIFYVILLPCIVVLYCIVCIVVYYMLCYIICYIVVFHRLFRGIVLCVIFGFTGSVSELYGQRTKVVNEFRGTRYHSWLRHSPTSLKVAG
jgi:hypothetical protein